MNLPPTQDIVTRAVDASLNCRLDRRAARRLHRPPLIRWILGFGPSARVISPEDLAQTVYEHVEAARERYAVRPRFAMAGMTIDELEQPSLPWRKIS